MGLLVEERERCLRGLGHRPEERSRSCVSKPMVVVAPGDRRGQDEVIDISILASPPVLTRTILRKIIEVSWRGESIGIVGDGEKSTQ